MIENLTPEQIATFPHYVEKWTKIGLNTDVCNFEKCCEIVDRIYEQSQLPPPKYKFGPFNNPIEAGWAQQQVDMIVAKYDNVEKANEALLKMTNDFFSKYNPEKDAPLKSIDINEQIYGSMDASWLSFYNFFQEQTELAELCKPLEPLMQLAEHCGWWIPLENAVLFQHRPLEIHFNAQNQLNNENGPAIKFRGNEICNIYAINGRQLTKKIIDRKFTVDDIESEQNQEIRTIMIRLYGQTEYMRDSKAELVHTDDFGQLFKKKVEGETGKDVWMYMVKVVNSTPEPDGTYKDYWIRVDPEAYGGLKTARAAVASTWRNDDGSLVFANPEDYDPQVES